MEPILCIASNCLFWCYSEWGFTRNIFLTVLNEIKGVADKNGIKNVIRLNLYWKISTTHHASTVIRVKKS